MSKSKRNTAEAYPEEIPVAPEGWTNPNKAGKAFEFHKKYPEDPKEALPLITYLRRSMHHLNNQAILKDDSPLREVADEFVDALGAKLDRDADAIVAKLKKLGLDDAAIEKIGEADSEYQY